MGNQKGAVDAAAKKPTKNCADPTNPCEVKIVSAQYLNGNDSTELGSDAKQWVNLPMGDKWVDGTHAMNKDRLSQQPRIKVRFSQPGTHTFKLKYIPGASNVAYSAGEKGRNANFKHEVQEKPYTTDADGTKIIKVDFKISAAGMHKYQVVATDEKGVQVKSFNIETCRLVHYKEIKMLGLTSVASSLSTLETEFTKHGVTLATMGSVNMVHMPNISDTDQATFIIKAKTAYTSSNAATKSPYVVAIAYTDHLAVKDSNQSVVKAGVKVGPSEPDIEIPIIDAAGKDKYLWNNIVPGEKWFVSASFLKNGDTAGTHDIVIAEADCTPVPGTATVPDMCRKVKVKVTGLAAATGTLTLKVNWVNRMRGGLSVGGNLICVCTRAWWRNTSTVDQNQIMIHEMGHKLGMVADGTGKLPDKTTTHYTQKGHLGPHCHEGLPVKASYSSDKGTCVMFGATSAITAFCSNCEPAVKKMDLSAGWSAF